MAPWPSARPQRTSLAAPARQPLSQPLRRPLPTLLAILLLAGCQSRPTLLVEITAPSSVTAPGGTKPEPKGFRLYRDGSLASKSLPKTFTPPYYGRILLEADGPENAHVMDKRSVRSLEVFEAAAPGWIFPLDFLVESADRILHGPQHSKVILQLPEAPPASRVNVEAAIRAAKAGALRR